MSSAAWLTFALVGGFVWGGFATLLAIALAKERAGRGEAGPAGER